VSSGQVSTRSRIVEAAQALIERGDGALSMERIAREAGLSRQTLYLTFADKAQLFIAVLRFADGERGIVDEQARIRAAPNGREALLAIVDMQARLSPAYQRLADAFELLRRQDVAAEAAWQDRRRDHLEGCRVVAARLAADGSLRSGIGVDTAADVIWGMTSSTVWNDLVVQRGWSADVYREHLGGMLLRSLTVDSRRAD